MKKIGSGKVREIYEVSDKELVIYTTDRVSAFDVILPTPVPEKGRVLNQLSLFWFDLTKDIVKNHLVSADPKDMPEEFSKEEYKDRVMLVKKLKMLPYEFIIRGYMFGSMWKAYKAGEPSAARLSPAITSWPKSWKSPSSPPPPRPPRATMSTASPTRAW